MNLCGVKVTCTYIHKLTAQTQKLDEKESSWVGDTLEIDILNYVDPKELPFSY